MTHYSATIDDGSCLYCSSQSTNISTTNISCFISCDGLAVANASGGTALTLSHGQMV